MKTQLAGVFMHQSTAALALLLISFLIVAIPTPSQARERCDLIGFILGCREVQHRQEPIPVTLVSESGSTTTNSNAVTPAALAEIDSRRFREFALDEVLPIRGYVRVGFQLTDGTNPYGNLGGSESFLGRSFVDWAKRYIAANQKLILVNLEVSKNDEVIWVKPIVSMEYINDFNLISVSDSRSLNGSTGFYNFSNQELTAKIAVYTADVNAVNRQRLQAVFDLADDLASTVAGLGPVGSVDNLISVFEVRSNSNYDARINTILENVSGFAQVSEISRSSTFKYENGGVAHMEYHFFAKDIDFTAFKLRAFLDFRPTLIDSRRSNDILSYAVYNEGERSFQRVESYLSSHDASRHLITQITNEEQLVAACGGIRDALNDVLVATDASIVLNAFVTERPNLFRLGIWDDRCFTSDDREAIEARGIQVAFAADETPSPVAAAPDDELFEYAQALGLLFKIDEENVFLAGSSQTAIWRQGGGNAISVIDEVGVVFGEPETRRQFPKDLTERLVSRASSRFGCMTRRLKSSEDGQPNVLSLLVRDERDRDIDVTIMFENAPANPNDPKVETIRFAVADGATLERFKLQCPQSDYFASQA